MTKKSKYDNFLDIVDRLMDFSRKEYNIGIEENRKKETIESIYNYFGKQEVLDICVRWFMKDSKLYNDICNMSPEQLDIFLTLRGY